MKETIYTIPVTEAFQAECECPLCKLETKLENEYVDYVLGASLMEPDSRKLTNEKGFCRKHFEQVYNKQENKLGLGLIIDTHMLEHNKKLFRASGMKPDYVDTHKEEEHTKTMGLKGAVSSIFSNMGKKKESAEPSNVNAGGAAIDRVISFLENYEEKCHICDKLDYTMGRYIEVIFYLYFEESEFRKMFDLNKGFCFPHLKNMLKYAKKLDSKKRDQIVGIILKNQIDNMERIEKEINWFTKKFDYRYDSEPWGNSRDAIPRSIKKLVGPCRFK